MSCQALTAKLPVLRQSKILLSALALFVVAVGQSFAQVTLDVDVDPLFTAANSYIPTFMTILGIAGGISIAIAIVSFIISKIVMSIRSAG